VETNWTTGLMEKDDFTLFDEDETSVFIAPILWLISVQTGLIRILRRGGYSAEPQQVRNAGGGGGYRRQTPESNTILEKHFAVLA